jgi:hypothetical protein
LGRLIGRGKYEAKLVEARGIFCVGVIRDFSARLGEAAKKSVR